MDYQALSKLPVFRGLSPEETRVLLESVPFRVRKYQASIMIYQSGEPLTSLSLIINGSVKGEMVDFAGRVIRIEEIPAPGALASAFLFGSRNLFPVNVIAVTDCELLVIEKSAFQKLLISNDMILANFLRMISDRSQFLSEKIKFLNFKTIKGKLAFYLLQKAGKDKNILILDMTQEEMSDYFGVTRPSIGRVLHEMENNGYIKAKGKNITILDRKGLMSLIYD